jgi:hypothetical protein
MKLLFFAANDWLQHPEFDATRIRDHRQVLGRGAALGSTFQSEETI